MPKSPPHQTPIYSAISISAQILSFTFPLSLFIRNLHTMITFTFYHNLHTIITFTFYHNLHTIITFTFYHEMITSRCSLCDMTFSTDDQNRLYCPQVKNISSCHHHCHHHHYRHHHCHHPHHDDNDQDYTKRFAAHCSVCKSAIVPKEGQTKVI